MKYNIKEMGAVNAIRVFYGEDGITPMAEITFAFGGSVIIQWNKTKERKEYEEGINGYTLFYDERTKEIPFSNFKRNVASYQDHIGEWIAFYSPCMRQIWHGRIISADSNSCTVKKRNGESRKVERNMILGICKKPTKSNPNPPYVYI